MPCDEEQVRQHERNPRAANRLQDCCWQTVWRISLDGTTTKPSPTGGTIGRVVGVAEEEAEEEGEVDGRNTKSSPTTEEVEEIVGQRERRDSFLSFLQQVAFTGQRRPGWSGGLSPQ